MRVCRVNVCPFLLEVRISMCRHICVYVSPIPLMWPFVVWQEREEKRLNRLNRSREHALKALQEKQRAEEAEYVVG